MKTGGFALEGYDLDDTCAFWVTAGCHAPTLKRLALCLTSLPCSSGEAERTWMEVKANMTKNHNRLDREKVEKMVFVRRFTRLKRKLAFQIDDTPFDGWIQELLKRAVTVPEGTDVAAAVGNDETTEVVNERHLFRDSIEPGEQGRINGKEPGEDPVSLGRLKRDNAAKGWLFTKYYDMCFVDKNPEGREDDDPLEDEEDWEHRVIKNIVWSRHMGWCVETHLHGNPTEQSIEKYEINNVLIDMIRDSPHNVRTMTSRVGDAAVAVPIATAPAVNHTGDLVAQI